MFVSPRLQDNSKPVLGDYALRASDVKSGAGSEVVLDWSALPESVAKLRFKALFRDGLGHQLELDADVLPVKRRDDLWSALFNAKTPVTPFAFEDRTAQSVLSYPVSAIQADIRTKYGTVIQNIAKSGDPTTMPDMVALQRNLERKPGGLLSVLPEGKSGQAAIDKHIAATLSTYKAIPPNSLSDGIPGLYQQLDQFMHPYPKSHKAVAPGTLRAGLQDMFDFHKIVAALGHYPELLPTLGLVIPLEVPANSGIFTSWTATVSVIPYLPGIPTFPRTMSALAQTHYVLQLQAGVFRAQPAKGSYLTGELLLRLSDQNSFDVASMDVDGAATKLVGMAENIHHQAVSPQPVAGLSPHQGMPAVRSSGISLIQIGRAYDLAQRFKTAASQNTALSNNAPVDLYADDLVRGYAVDVHDEKTGKWYPLHQRDGTFVFSYPPPAKQGGFSKSPVSVPTSGEGFVTLSATQPSTSSNAGGANVSDPLYLHEQICRWTGWSLAAPRPFTPIGTGDPSDYDTPPANASSETPDAAPTEDLNRTGLRLTANFTAPEGTLPRLRFGRTYQMRARMVDVAGHATGFDTGDSKHGDAQTKPTTYLRWEPLVAPAIALAESIADRPAESMGRMVVRSYVPLLGAASSTRPALHPAAIYNPTSQRHFLPPKTSVTMAEVHGKFDTPTPSGRGWYDVVANLDGSLPQQRTSTPNPALRRPLHPSAGKLTAPQPRDIVTYEPTPLGTGPYALPYLPDPLAAGVTFVGLPGHVPVKGDIAFTDPVWTGTWPYLSTFILVLNGIPAGTTPRPPSFADGRPATVTVEVEQGVTTAVRYSSRMAAESIPLMAMWDWIVANIGTSGKLHDRFYAYAVRALLWLLTPYHELTIVHAVQRPLMQPQFLRLSSVRNMGDTSARLYDRPMKISGHSTVKMDLEGHWFEPIDDVNKPGPEVREHKSHVSEIPINYQDGVLQFPADSASITSSQDKHFTHVFGDTKYRRVAYTMVATTRYREYFPFTDDEIAQQPDLITQANKPDQPTKPKAALATVSKELIDRNWQSGLIDVPSSARPYAPSLLYVMPIFKHDMAVFPAENMVGAARWGGGLRVYLERPWYSSGEGELLGVVLPPYGAGGSPAPDPAHYTQWALDPLWKPASMPVPISPTPELFTNAVWQGTGLSIDEQKTTSSKQVPLVDVAGHAVAYDADRRLWYADILLSPGTAYYPFVRLVLARCQPHALTDARLSRLVVADFAQIAPDRIATIVFDSPPASQNSVTLRVSVLGQIALHKLRLDKPDLTPNRIEINLEAQVVGSPNTDPDLGWFPVAALDPSKFNADEKQAPFPDAGAVILKAAIQHKPKYWDGRALQPDGDYMLWSGAYTLTTGQLTVLQQHLQELQKVRDLPPQSASSLPPLRLVIREYETFPAATPDPNNLDWPVQTIDRLVYAEVLDLMMPS